MHKVTLSAHTRQPVDIARYEADEPLSVFKHNEIPLVFFTPNQTTLWRVETFYTKEPDTLEWIGSFSSGQVLLDIGANVGMYSVFAAKTRQVKVFAFEPESQNFGILNRNLYYNQLDALVQAFPLAISNERKLDTLYVSKFVAGGSCHNFAAATNAFEQPMQPAFRQGAYSISMDTLIADGAIPVPDHIKIDVDGLEPKVVQGMMNTLSDAQVRTVLIEINSQLASHHEIVRLMKSKGFGYSDQQVLASQRTEGAFKGVGNVIFRR